MPRTVLVVDDEELVLDVTVSMLEDMGCEVVAATYGADALSILAGDPRIEILITDINMPGMSGYELAERAGHQPSRLAGAVAVRSRDRSAWVSANQKTVPAR